MKPKPNQYLVVFYIWFYFLVSSIT